MNAVPHPAGLGIDESPKAVVLIVDDSLTVRMDLAQAFAAGGFHPLPCATACEARAVLAGSAVQAVILDVILPDGNGVDLLRELHEAPGAAPPPVVVMLSTEAEVKDRLRGLRTGADEYVGKPYDAGFVVAKVRELLRARVVALKGDATVLVIDDSATFREALRAALEAVGYSVLVACTGEEGLRVAAAQRPGAVVVDGMLPGIDGTTVIRHIRLDAALRDVPCLLLTAAEDKGAELRALDAGADAFLRKDEDVAVILARLAAVLRTRAGGSHLNDTASLLDPKRILAVDDSPTYLEALSDALRGEGYDVIPARSGEEALELLAIQSVDCILLDLQMPGLGGEETCRRIKTASITRNVPLVILTSLEDRQAMVQGLGAGADDYITKSDDLQLLKARVRAQIRRKQFEDENRRIREEVLHNSLAVTRAAMVDELELRVEARTVELENANKALKEEIEERRRAEEALVTTEGQFRQSQKMEAVGRLAGGIAHDFNNLLSIILSTSQMAAMDVTPGTVLAADLTQISDAAMRAAKLTKQLLAFSRKQVLQPKVLDLNLVLRDIDQMLKRVISEDIEISTAAEPAIGRVVADPGQIEQVILNLVVNSRDAMPKGGKITLETANVYLDDAYVRHHVDAVVGPHVMLAVSDTGHGMDAKTQARIFEPFFTTRELGKGTGLGLSTVYGIVRQSGGSVLVYSEPGIGTTFKIYLPAVDQDLDVATAENRNVASGTETILLVEDEAMVRAVAQRILVRAGYNVFEAADGEVALRFCQEHPEPIHLLLTDVVLQKENGRLVADHVLALRPDMKVLFMSGYTDDAIVHHGVLDSGTNFLEKPFTPNALGRRVREVLDGLQPAVKGLARPAPVAAA